MYYYYVTKHFYPFTHARASILHEIITTSNLKYENFLKKSICIRLPAIATRSPPPPLKRA